jgi:dienelactone hydrolase
MRARLAASALAFAVAACATDGIITTRQDGSEDRIPASLVKPEGPGPFPAVVMLHDCSGLGHTSSGAPGRWANELAAHGYVVLIPDSFTSRGYPGGVCTEPSPTNPGVYTTQRARDAHAALAHLRTLPFVDGARIGVMGGSHGGSTTLIANLRAGFAGAVALYPRCAARMGEWHADLTGVYMPASPLLILIGGADDWTPAEPCRKLADAAQKAGYPVSIKIYPGVHHSFDSVNPQRYVAARANINSPTGRGATTGGNPAAWADSIREVLAFFGRNLAANC